MTVNWFGSWQILVAFNNSIYDDLTAINTVATAGSPGVAPVVGAHNVWTDITIYCQNLRTHRGRQHLIDQFVTGTADITLWNGPNGNADAAGRFDSWNTSSPLTGLIDAGKPVRIQCTVNGTTYPVWTGYADVWASQWPSETKAITVLSCVDAFQVWQNAYTVSTLYPKQVIADGAAGYWRLGDPVGATMFYDTIAATYDANAVPGTATITFGQAGALPLDTNTGVELQMPTSALDQQTIGLWNSTVLPTGTTGATMEWWMKVSSVLGNIDGPAGAMTFKQSGTTYQMSWVLNVVASAAEFAITDAQSGRGIVITAGAALDGNWHLIEITANGATGAITLYIDGASAGSGTITGGAFTAWTGPVQQYLSGESNTNNLNVFFQDWAIYPSVLSSGQAANHDALAVGVGVESSGARLNRILNWVGWPANPRNIDTGSSQIQAIAEALTGTTILAYIQLVALSENGALFMDRSGNVRFIARWSLLTGPYNTSQQTFGDGVGEVPFEPVPQIAKDTLDTYTIATVQRQNGLIQTVTNQTASTAYGPRTYQPNQLLVTSDIEVQEYAQWEVNHLSVPLVRVRQIVVHPASDPTGGTAAVAVLNRELMDRVTVNKHTLPGGGTGFSVVSLIEGIDHQVDFEKGDWTCNFALDPADTLPYWILGTSQLGTTTRLAY